MTTGICIITHNQKKFLYEKLIPSFEKQTIRVDQLVIVDDNSTENYEIEKYNGPLSIKYIRLYRDETCPVTDFRAVARNVALKNCDTDFILFLDGDTWIEEKYIEKALFVLERNPRCFLVGNRLDPNNRIINFFRNQKLEWSEKNWIDFYSANFSFFRMYIDENDFLDPNFGGWGWEDHELAYRYIFLKGFKHIQCYEMVSYHIEHNSKTIWQKSGKDFCRNAEYFLTKYPTLQVYADICCHYPIIIPKEFFDEKIKVIDDIFNNRHKLPKVILNAYISFSSEN